MRSDYKVKKISKKVLTIKRVSAIIFKRFREGNRMKAPPKKFFEKFLKNFKKGIDKPWKMW